MEREIPIDKIRCEPVRDLSKEHLKRLVESGDDLPAVSVRLNRKGGYDLIDGLHRVLRAKQLGQAAIKARIIAYSPDEHGQMKFELDRYGFNVKHGLPLTRKQRDEAIHKLWSEWHEKGLTLEKLGDTFTLTKQRIQQILDKEPRQGHRPISKFRSAVKRMRTQLQQITSLVIEDPENAERELLEIQGLIEKALQTIKEAKCEKQ